MGKVTIENLEIGMVLSGDVHDRSGRMLLGAGAELTQKHLVIFHTWGVVEADIEGVGDTASADDLPPDIDPIALAESEQKLVPLFRHTNKEHPAIIELMKLAALRKVRHGNA